MYHAMIHISHDREHEGEARGRGSPGSLRQGFPHDLVRRTRAILSAMDAAVVVDDLRFPPGNRLEALRGSRAGQYSVRINDQWRVCFVWTDRGPADVEIVDYH